MLYFQDCDQSNMLQTHVVGSEIHGKKIFMIVDFLQVIVLFICSFVGQWAITHHFRSIVDVSILIFTVATRFKLDIKLLTNDIVQAVC